MKKSRLLLRPFVLFTLISIITSLAISTAAFPVVLSGNQINFETLRAFAGLRTALLEVSPRIVATIGTCDTAGPIEIESDGGLTTPTAYASMQLAFAAINTGVHTGPNINIEVCGNTAEAATAVLNASGGTASYSAIFIRPAGGVARTISGTVNAPYINFNGADFVTIDGLNTGGNSITISNSSTSTTAGTSAIRFISDATNNVVQNATINGAATGASTGTIIFSTATTTGNDNNTITACNIGPVVATFPTNAIFSSGTATTVATRNSGIQITNNNIFDFVNEAAAVDATGVFASTGNTDWTVSGNSLYQTASRSMPAGSGLIGISFADTTGVNFTASGNFIGGSAPSAGGSAWTQTGATTHTFIGIRMSVGTATASEIQGNTIRNISVTTSNASTVNAAISAVSGSINVGTTTGNTIGSTVANGSILYTGAAASSFNGILAGTGAPGAVTISNNTIGGITVAGAGNTTLRGIRMEGPATSVVISNNIIGSTTVANSIQSGANISLLGISSTDAGQPNTITGNTIANVQHTSAGTNASFRGIESTGAVNGHNVSNNVIRDIASASTSTNTTATPAIAAIFASNVSNGRTISGNTIFNLSNSAPAQNVQVIGILTGTAASSGTMNANLIYDLSTASTGTTAGNRGIFLNNAPGTAAWNLTNNMIRLGTTISLNPIVRGIDDSSATTGTNTNVWFNSIFIGGTQSLATQNTAALFRAALGTMDLRDNILWNNRASTGAPGVGTGRHYAIQNGAGGSLTSDYNVLYAPNNGGTVGRSAGVDYVTLLNWRTGTGFDLNSLSGDPLFIAATAATPNLHIQPASGSIVEANGFDVGVLTDFDGQTRATLTPVDIGADAGNFAAVAQPGQLNFNPASYNPVESVGTFTLTVTRTGGDDGVVTVDYSTPLGALTRKQKSEGAIPTANGGASCLTPGVDYITTSGTLTFADGDTSESFNITICDDAVFEGSETFGVQLSNATGGATIGAANQASVIIQDNDAAPTISINDVSIAEGESGFAILTFTVSKSGSTALAASVNFQSSDITATSAVGQPCGTPSIDYEGGSGGLTFQPNDTTQSINVAICGDVLAEADETFRITLSGASNATITDNEGIGTITDNESATLVVDNLTDNIGLNACTAAANDCSLRGANSIAVDGDTIIFDSGVFGLEGIVQTIAVGSELLIANDIMINGPGADNLTIDGGAPDDNRVFTVNNATATISGMTIQNGGGVGSIGSGGGGAVYAAGGALTLDRVHVLGSTAGTCGGGVQFDAGTHVIRFSTISGNLSSSIGGGVCNSGVSSLTIHNSTISGNTSTSSGGGMANNIGATLRISNSTVTLNNSGSNGGGVVQTGISLILEGSIIAGNIDSLGTPEISNGGGATSNGYNIVGDSANDAQNTGVAILYQPVIDILNTPPQLGGLADNGGPTLTHRPDENGPGHDKGRNFGVPPFATDQRGNARTVDWGITNAPGGDGTDIGSVELLVPTAATATISGRVKTFAGRGIANVMVLVQSAEGEALTSALTNSFGYFTLHGLPVGETYIVAVKTRRYRFGNPSQLVSLQDNIVGMEFIADP